MSSSSGSNPKVPSRLIAVAALVAIPVVISSILLLLDPTQLDSWRRSFLVSLVAYVPGLSSVSWISSINHQASRLSSPSHSLASSSVARIHWSRDKPYATYLRSLSEPVVLIDTYESIVVPKYTVESIAANMLAHHKRVTEGGAAIEDIRISGLFKHSSPIFGPYYDKGRPMHHLKKIQAGGLGARALKYESNASLPASDIGKVFRSGGPPYYALSIDPSLLHLDGIDLRAMLAVRSNRSSVNVWLGMRGGTTPCHFDGYHNMYLQLSGEKTFHLFPPTMMGDVRPFPFLHPSYAQCQAIDLAAGEGASDETESRRHVMEHIGKYTDIITSNKSNNSFGDSNSTTSSKVTSGIFREISAAYKDYVMRHSATPSSNNRQMDGIASDSSSSSMSSKESTSAGTSGYLTVTLKPGEMLYLPPFWIHEVVSETASVAVNVWTGTVEEEAFQKILSIPIPGLSDNYNTKGLRSEVESRERNDHRAANYYDSEESCPPPRFPMSTEDLKTSICARMVLGVYLFNEIAHRTGLKHLGTAASIELYRRYEPLFESGQLPRIPKGIEKSIDRILLNWMAKPPTLALAVWGMALQDDNLAQRLTDYCRNVANALVQLGAGEGGGSAVALLPHIWLPNLAESIGMHIGLGACINSYRNQAFSSISSYAPRSLEEVYECGLARGAPWLADVLGRTVIDQQQRHVNARLQRRPR